VTPTTMGEGVKEGKTRVMKPKPNLVNSKGVGSYAKFANILISS
jgi:hypothetical protein